MVINQTDHRSQSEEENAGNHGMDAKAFLSQAKDLERLINVKKEHLKYLREMASWYGKGLGSEPVKHSRNVEIMQNAVLRIVEAEGEIGDVLLDLLDKRMEISRMIDRLEDYQLRYILEKRYLCYLEWEEIGREAGLTVKTCTNKHAIALQLLQEILDNSP